MNAASAELILELVRTVRDGLAAAKQLGVEYPAVTKKAHEIEAAGGEFGVEDAKIFLAEADAQIALNEEHARAARAAEAKGQL
jgi:hypothetical protein